MSEPTYVLWDGISASGDEKGLIQTSVSVSTGAKAFTKETMGDFKFVPTNETAQEIMSMDIDGPVPFVVPKKSYLESILRRHTEGATKDTRYYRGLGENLSPLRICAEDMYENMKAELKFDSDANKVTAQKVFYSDSIDPSGSRPFVTIVVRIQRKDPYDFPDPAEGVTYPATASVQSDLPAPAVPAWLDQTAAHAQSPVTSYQPARGSTRQPYELPNLPEAISYPATASGQSDMRALAVPDWLTNVMAQTPNTGTPTAGPSSHTPTGSVHQPHDFSHLLRAAPYPPTTSDGQSGMSVPAIPGWRPETAQSPTVGPRYQPPMGYTQLPPVSQVPPYDTPGSVQEYSMTGQQFVDAPSSLDRRTVYISVNRQPCITNVPTPTTYMQVILDKLNPSEAYFGALVTRSARLATQFCGIPYRDFDDLNDAEHKKVEVATTLGRVWFRASISRQSAAQPLQH